VWSTGPLSSGPHTVKIAWTGQRNPRSIFTYVDVDAFDVVGTLTGGLAPTTTTVPTTTTAPTTTTTVPTTTTTTAPTTTTTTAPTTTTTTAPTTTTTTAPSATTRYEQTDPNLVYTGTWTSSSSSTLSGGTMKYTFGAGASVTISFTGTYLAWIARTGASYGIAQVTLDGGTPVLVDLYSSATFNQQAVWSTGPLSSGPHTVKIAWTGQRNPRSIFTYVDVDAFDVVGTLRFAGTMGFGVLFSWPAP
jgi:hypothetical protein